MKQKQRNKARKNSKKTRKVTKWNKRTWKDKKINKRKRERQGMKRKSEGNQGERKWDIEKWTKITLFQGGKQCFCKQTNKKTKRKERLRANCPKTHVQGCVDPSWRRKRRKKQNTKGREGICKISPHKFTKTVSKKGQKTAGKLEKTIRTAAASRFLAAARIERNRDGGVNSKTRQKVQKLVRGREKWEKRHFQNLLGSAAPGLFLASKTNLVKNSNFRKSKFVRRRKNCVKNGLQHEGATTGPTQFNQALQRKIAPKPLVYKRFASHYLLDCAWKEPRPENTRKKGKFVRT